jgi:hypothetical protein
MQRWTAALWVAVVASVVFISPAANATEPVALTPDQVTLVNAARAQTLPAWLSTADRALATQSAELCRQGKSTESNALWQKIVQANVSTHSMEELNAVSRWTVRTCQLADKPELLAKAMKAGQTTDLYSDTRSYLGVLKGKLAGFPPPPASSVTIPVKTVTAGRLVDQGSKAITKAGLQALIVNIEPQLNKAGDDAQLANIDLQNVMQKQQQLIQMISNISKLMSDTTQAIIRKIGG